MEECLPRDFPSPDYPAGNMFSNYDGPMYLEPYFSGKFGFHGFAGQRCVRYEG